MDLVYTNTHAELKSFRSAGLRNSECQIVRCSLLSFMMWIHNNVSFFYYLGRVRTLCARYGKPCFWILLKTEVLGNHREVRAGETKHECRPFPLVDDGWVNRFRLEYGLAIGIQHELQSSQVPDGSSRKNHTIEPTSFSHALFEVDPEILHNTCTYYRAIRNFPRTGALY